MRGPVEQIWVYVVDVDFHPPRPGRCGITRRLPDANINEAAGRAFARDLAAEEFKAGPVPLAIACQRFARLRLLGSRPRVSGLQAVHYDRHMTATVRSMTLHIATSV